YISAPAEKALRGAFRLRREAELLHDGRHVEAEPALDDLAILNALKCEPRSGNPFAGWRVSLPFAGMRAAKGSPRCNHIAFRNHLIYGELPGAESSGEHADTLQMHFAVLRFWRAGRARYQRR